MGSAVNIRKRVFKYESVFYLMRKCVSVYGNVWLCLCRYFEHGVYSGMVETTVIQEICTQLAIDPNDLFLLPVYTDADVKLLKRIRNAGMSIR